MLKKLNLSLINLSVLLSVIFLFFVAIVASVDNSQYFLHLLMLLFTAVLIKKVKDKSEKLFWMFFIIGLLLIPVSNIVVEAILLLIFVDFVVLSYKSYPNCEIILKSLNLIGILFGVFYLVYHLYPNYESNPITVLGFITVLLFISLALFSTIIYLLVDILKADSRAQAG